MIPLPSTGLTFYVPESLEAQEIWSSEERVSERDLMVAAQWQDCVIRGGQPSLVEVDDPDSPLGPGVYVACAAVGVVYTWLTIPAVLQEFLFPSDWVAVPPG